MNRLHELEFDSFISQQSVAPSSVAFGWCGAGQGCDFGSSNPIKFGDSTRAGLVIDDVGAKGLIPATQVDDGGFAHFNSDDDFGVWDACVGEEEDSGSFDGSDVGAAFAGERGELLALFAGQFDWVDFGWHTRVYYLKRRCTQSVVAACVGSCAHR
jgi:hypothetical protein